MTRLRVMVLGVCSVAAWIPAAGADREPTNLGGISLVPPVGWRQQDSESFLRHQVRGLSRRAKALEILGHWVDEASRAHLSLGVSNQYTRISASKLEQARAIVEEEVAGIRGIQRFRVDDIRIAEVDGLPAYRIRSHLEMTNTAVEQLQYVVAAARTYVLTFSSPIESYPEYEPLFADVVASVRLAERPSVLQTAPVWLWGAIVGSLLVCVVGLRRAFAASACSPRVEREAAGTLTRSP